MKKDWIFEIYMYRGDIALTTTGNKRKMAPEDREDACKAKHPPSYFQHSTDAQYTWRTKWRSWDFSVEYVHVREYPA